MSTVYWIYKDGHQGGPFTFSKIQVMRNAGTIGVTDQIRRMDEQQWHLVGKISHPPRLGRYELRCNAVAVIMLILCLGFAGAFILVVAL